MLNTTRVFAPSPRCSRRILLSHDDAALIQALAAGLRRVGHLVAIQPDATFLANDAAVGRADLVVLEPALLPPDEAISLCATLQRCGGVWLALIARQPDPSIVVALLRAGADAYLQLPASSSVLLEQLLAIVRRPPPPPVDVLRPVSAHWSLDERERRLVGGNRVLPLSDLECRLLVTFLDRLGDVLGRPELLTAVWGSGYTNGREVDQYVYYLRRKVEDEPTQPRVIMTVERAGYLYRPPGQTPA